MPTSPAPDRRSLGTLLIFALAYAGGTIGYLPFLSLLLPIKVEVMAGEERIQVLTAAVIGGALAASLSNIVFGWLSDAAKARGYGRRGGLALGIALTAASYAFMASAGSPEAIVIGVVLFQCAINALLAPLMAIIADEVPDAQKGLAGGMMSLASPLASAVAAALVSVAMLGEPSRFGCIAAATAACVLPMVLSRERLAAPAEPALADVPGLRRDLLIAWIARLLVQVAGNVLSLYLLYYFESVSPGEPPLALATHVSHVLTLAYVVPLPIAVLLGRLSDRIGRRKPILLGAIAVAALGLLVMGLAEERTAGAIGFGAYAVGSQVFLVLHATFAMQLLPSPAHRGRDLGFLNLTNTLPAFVGPLLAWLLATPETFAPLMLLLAVLTLAGGATMLAIQGRR